MAEAPHEPAGGPPVDPSMEDILASIRRILSEDEQAPAAAAEVAPAPSAPPPPVVQPVAVATSAVQLPAVLAGPAPTLPEPEPDIFALDDSMLIDEPTPLPQPVPIAMPTPVMREPVISPGEPLVAPEAMHAASQSVGSLLRGLSSERHVPVYRGGPSIEDIVRDEMRPMLKEWLDSHLPPLVERLVRAELERLSARAIG